MIKPGMIAEATCIGKPLSIIPMVVTEVQDYIAAGQIKPTDLLIDAQQASRPGTLTVFLEPLYEGGFASIPPVACASPMPIPTITICSPTRTSAPGGGCSFTSLTRSHWCTP